MLTTLSFMSCRKAENLTTNSDDVPPGLLCFIWLLSRKIYLVSSQTTPVVSKRWIDSLLWAVVKATNMTSFNGTNVLEVQINIPCLTVTRQRGPTLKNTFHEVFNISMLTITHWEKWVGFNISESALLAEFILLQLKPFLYNLARNSTVTPTVGWIWSTCLWEQKLSHFLIIITLFLGTSGMTGARIAK